jgi:hypothetical protein
MTLGSVLLQPQRIQRAIGKTADESLVEDVLSLFTRLVADQSQGGQLLTVMEQALQGTAARFSDRPQTAFNHARQRLTAWLQPLIGQLINLGKSIGSVDEPGDVVPLLKSLLTDLTHLVQNLTLDQLRHHLSEFLDIIETDLGLTNHFLEDQIWLLFDDLIQRLQQMPPGISATERENRLNLASILQRLKQRLQSEFHLPDFNADTLALAIQDWLERWGIQFVAGRVNCIGTGLTKAFEGVSALLDLIPVSNFGAGSVGAAAASAPSETYCWYASWLLGDDVKINAARTRITKGDDELLTGTNLDWPQLPIFKASSPQHYSFKNLTPDEIEGWARHTAWIADFGEVALHLTSLEAGDFLSNSLNAATLSVYAIYRLASEKPVPSGLNFLFRLLATLGGSFEQMHTHASALNWFTFWLTLIGTDTFEAYLYYSIIGGARDALLSALTLINYDGDFYAPPSGNDNRPENRKTVGGLVSTVTGLITSQIFIRVIPREEFSLPFVSGGQAAKMFLLWHVLGGLTTGLLGGFVGTAIAQFAFAQGQDLSVLVSPFTESMFFKSVIQVWISFWPSFFMGKDGDTDDGKYNPNGDAFAGYPAHTTSPYNLPYESGKLVQCGQGNQGLWSHHRFYNQVYAYDFALDQDVEILATRPGTVIDWFDQRDDDTTADWNFIIIRHDVDDAGNPIPPNSDHDKGAGGIATRTYAVYGHGRKNSIREAFSSRGIADGSITGSKVKKGQLIMRSGDTGMSFYNHLHMDVRPGPDSGNVTYANLAGAGTLPFVFKEVTHLFGQDGVPRSFQYYTSENPKVN